MDGNTWVLELEDIEKETSRLLQKTLFEDRQFKSTKNAFEKGDVLYGKLRPYLDKVIVADENGVCSTEIMPIKIYCQMSAEYVRVVLKSPKFIEYVNSSTHGMRMPRLGTDKAKLAVIPLPPLPEQHAIVQIVNTLLQEVEQLEQLTQQRLQLKEQYAASALHQLATAPAPDAWAALQPHFHTFFNEAPNIQKLRAAILQLAVQGKLTANWRRDNPEVEPAGVLLERIQREKARLVKEKKIKKEKALPPITEDEILFDIPKEWEWCRLLELISILGDGIHGTPKYDPHGEYYFINGNNLTDGVIEIKPNTKKVAKEEYLKHKRELNEKTVFVSINGTIGNTAFYNNEKVILGKSACYFNLLTEVDKQYIRNLVKSKYFLDYALLSATGTTIKNVSLRTMRSFPVPIPTQKEQKVIVKLIDNLLELCNSLEQQASQRQSQSAHLLQSALKEVFAPSKVPVQT